MNTNIDFVQMGKDAFKKGIIASAIDPAMRDYIQNVKKDSYIKELKEWNKGWTIEHLKGSE